MSGKRLGGAVISVLALCAASVSGAGELTWKTCLDLASRHNPALAAGGARVDAAEAGIGVARSALLPQVSAGASADRSRDPQSSGGDTAYGIAVNVEQALYSGGRNMADLRAAHASSGYVRAQACVTGVQLTCDLRTAFIDLLFAREQVRLSADIEKRRADNCELVDLRYGGGREHKGSLASSQAALFAAQTQLRQSQRTVSVNADILFRTIGITSTPDTAVAATLAGELEAVETAKNQLPLEALACRTPEYYAAQALREVAAAQLESARSAHLPEVSLAGSAGRSGQDNPLEDNAWSVGVKLTLPLWSGGRTVYSVKKAGAAVKEAEAVSADTFNSALRSLSAARQALDSALENVAVEKRYVEAAEIRSGIARQQYEDGLLSFENWDLIEEDMISKQKRQLEAARSALEAEVAWWRAAGRNAFAPVRPETEGGK